MFLGIPRINKFVNAVKVSPIDDFTDRCNYYYTVLLFIFFTLLVGTKQYFGEPIKCAVEQQAPASWTSYVHDYCFVMERYKLTPPEFMSSGLAEFYTKSDEYYENYYQWTPFLLLVQAFCFYIPHFLWRSLQKLSSLDIEMVVEEAIGIRQLFGEERQKATTNLAKYIEQSLSVPSNRWCRLLYCPLKDILLCSTWLYIGSKLLNSVNIIIQLMLISRYVGDGGFFWGRRFLEQLIYGIDWTETGQFPRVVYCDYEMVSTGNVEKKNVQCTLTINMLNEKIYLILVVWLFLLSICTISNALFTVVNVLVPSLRERQTRFYLMASLPADEDDESLGALYYSEYDSFPSALFVTMFIMFSVHAFKRRNNYISRREHELLPDRGSEIDQDELKSFFGNESERTLRHFLRSVLGVDGVQLLRFMHSHAGTMIARDVTFILWEDFLCAKRSQNQFCQSRSRTFILLMFDSLSYVILYTR
ncbi:unnamed protein product [Enterobius vermicularis]|uniref:Innexin n=1 Tax=Enterobius vermicularis TaxID=51028 RepID=A0A0N4VFE5_ENTVE|nr:unnamed protein product [Enterobius vermicularis]